jgi:XTP/dITP diphosphohydrolase
MIMAANRDRDMVLASNNPGKAAELSRMLGERGFRIIPQSEFNTPEAEETAASFVENALIKARNAAATSGLPSLADDSGLCVDSLEGLPGVRSARYAGPAASDSDNVEKLLAALDGHNGEARRARFVCLMVLVRHALDPLPLIAQGEWPGHIALQAAGAGGFGYDPVFIPDGYSLTAAELEPDEKNRISHRGQALRQLIEQL